MKRPASVSASSSIAKRKPIAKKKPARALGIQRKPAKAPQSMKETLARLRKKSKIGFDFILAENSFDANTVVFKEKPLVARQAARSDAYVQQQPLFCSQCFVAVGPLESALALIANRISRAELLEFARCNEGDVPSLLRWLDFASKTPALPECTTCPALSSPAIFSWQRNGQVDASLCFCSAACRESCGIQMQPSSSCTEFTRYAEKTRFTDVLCMSADIIAAKCWPAGLPISPDLAHANLASILQVAAKNEATIPAYIIRKSYSLLIGTLAQECRKAARKAVPPDTYSCVVSTLELRSWGLNGTNMPSSLGRYCEHMCDRDVCSVSQAAMLASLGPVVKTLTEQQEALDSDADDTDDEDVDNDRIGEIGNIQLPSVETARLVKPLVVKSLFSEEDIALCKRVSQESSSQEHHKHQVGAQWVTRYLHANGSFRQNAGPLLERLLNAIIQADSPPLGLGLLANVDLSLVHPRVIEHHIVSPGGSLPDPTHFDGGSLLTIDVMLNQPGSDFTGGEFCTVEQGGSVKHHEFGKGDVLIFYSHKPHYVQPVKTGIRETLIMELWEGVERRCDHRCPQHFGLCPLEASGPPKVSSSSVTETVGAASEAAAIGIPAIQRDASGAFAASAFEGTAFFAKVAKVMSQSSALRQVVRNLKPNIEITFEDCGVVACVRSLSKIRRGDALVAADYNASDSELNESTDEEEASNF